MKKLNEFLAQENHQTYNPAGFHILSPMERGLRTVCCYKRYSFLFIFVEAMFHTKNSWYKSWRWVGGGGGGGGDPGVHSTLDFLRCSYKSEQKLKLYAKIKEQVDVAGRTPMSPSSHTDFYCSTIVILGFSWTNLPGNPLFRVAAVYKKLHFFFCIATFSLSEP